MSIIGDVLDSWREDHEAGVCADRARRNETKCPFCESARTGLSLADLMEG